MPSPKGATGRALSNPALQTRDATLIEASHEALRDQLWRQPDGAVERARPANVCSVRRSCERPQP